MATRNASLISKCPVFCANWKECGLDLLPSKNVGVYECPRGHRTLRITSLKVPNETSTNCTRRTGVQTYLFAPARFSTTTTGRLIARVSSFYGAPPACADVILRG